MNMKGKKLFLATSAIAIMLAVGHIFTIGYGFGYDVISRAEIAIEQATKDGYQPSHLAVIYERNVGQRNDFLHLEIDTTYRAIGRNAFRYEMICDHEVSLRAFDGEYTDCSEIAANCFIFADNSRQWQISQERKLIIDQQCKLATINIDGQEYRAWYTTALPHCAKNARPNKIMRGLILEASNAVGSYTLKAKHIAQHLG